MKRLMRKQFIHSYYHREIYQKLQNLTQGSKSVEDYFKEMEITLIRANIEEDKEATIARFVSGLNREIANMVELHHYMELEELVHMATKVERQLKRKTPSRPQYSNDSNPWSSAVRTDEHKFKVESSTPKETTSKTKDNPEPKTIKTRDLTCFRYLDKGHIASQCPNQWAMLLKDNGKVESKHSEGELEVKEHDSDEGIERSEEWRTLVLQKNLSTPIVEDDIERDEGGCEKQEKRECEKVKEK